MLKNIKAFINVQFKISEVEDDVYSSSESEDDEQEQEESYKTCVKLFLSNSEPIVSNTLKSFV